MSSPFKRNNEFGSSSFGFGIILLLFAFICTTKLYDLPVDPQSSIGEYNNYYNNDDKSKEVIIKGEDINSVRIKNLTPVHHPTHLVTDDGVYIHNGDGYKIFPSQDLAHFVVQIVQAGITDENDIPQLLGDLIYVLSPDQLEDIFSLFDYLITRKKNGGHVSDQAAVDFLIKVHDDKEYRRTVVKGRHQEILNDFFNVTSIKNNFKLTFPKHIGLPINERPLAVYMATNQETPQGKSRRRGDGDTRRRREDDGEGAELEDVTVDMNDLLSSDRGEENMNEQEGSGEGMNKQEGSDVQDEDKMVGVEEEKDDGGDVKKTVLPSDEDIELYTESPNEYDDNEVLTEARLELNMDIEGEKSTASSTDGNDKGVDLIIVNIPADSGSHFAPTNTPFGRAYTDLLSQTTSSPGRPATTTLITEGDFSGQLAITPIDFHRYVQDLDALIRADPSAYNTPEQLEKLVQEMNTNRDMLGIWVRSQIPPKCYDDVNFGTRFSLSHSNLFLKHYSPTGVLCVVGDDLNHMRDNQCCIHTAWSKIPSFLYNEHAKVDMNEYKYGGKDHMKNSGYAAFGDLVPFDCEKVDNERDMNDQYDEWAKRLGMKSRYELMAIQYSLARLHLLLHRVNHQVNPDTTPSEMKVHVMSAATAKYYFGHEGFVKYQMKHVSDDWYSITFGPHSQASWYCFIV